MKKSSHKTIQLSIAIMILVAIMLMSGFVFVMIQNKFINDDQQTEREKEKQRDIMREELIHQANSLMKSYYYHEAIDLLKSVPEIYNDKLKAEVDKIEDFISKLRPYEGRIEHIFMHSLIVYPELAFNANSSQPQGYNYWMITQREFEIILPLLLEKGYVLVRISDLYHVDELGNVFKKELYLPQGKRPLLMSIDNVGYPTSRANEGFATRLVIDNNNEVSAVIRTIEGNEIESRTAEVFPIVDDFVKAHPEFSYKGAKGILGITGSWGVMGYNPKVASDAEAAQQVAQRLKELGWEFASHSYTHADGKYFSESSTLEGVKEDTALFERWITPIIGETNVFIAPFGITLKGDLYHYFTDKGYTFYLNVDRRSQPKIIGQSVLMPRVNIDGFVMNRDKEYITEHFFDVDKVYDVRRPPFQ